MSDLSALFRLDQPSVLQVLFHPRRQGHWPPPEEAQDLLFRAYDGVLLGARHFPGPEKGPTVLFFHGNGEIAEDYADIGPMFNRLGLGFLVADFRGYGASQGRPTVTNMITDAHAILGETKRFLENEGKSASLWVMGRSLGSASALELASECPDQLDGLIIESGFARTLELLAVLGVDPQSLGLAPEDDALGHLAKIAKATMPTLVIHAEFDHIIPLDHGEDLFAASGAEKKEFYLVKGANHNDIFARDLAGYLETVQRFVLR